jgi:hypothetical protein
MCIFVLSLFAGLFIGLRLQANILILNGRRLFIVEILE